MAKTPNASKSAPLTVTVSEQSAELLERLAKRGIYGRSGAEVAGRFIDQALAQFVEAPRFRQGAEGEVKEGAENAGGRP